MPFNNEFIFIVFYICIFVYVMVIIVNLNTGIFYHGAISNDRKKILYDYVYTYLVYDVFCLTALLTKFFKTENTWYTILMEMIIFLKLFSLENSFKKLELKAVMYGNRAHIRTLIILFSNLFLIVHIVGCVWNLISELEMRYLGET